MALALGEGRTAKAELVGREVDEVEARLVAGAQHGLHRGADVIYLAAGRYDDRSRGDDFLAAGVLLGEGEGVLAGGHVDAQGAAEERSFLFAV